MTDKKEVTIQTFNDDFDTVINELQEVIDELKKSGDTRGIRKFQTLKKKLIKLRKSTRYLRTKKNKQSSSPRKPPQKKKISKELAEFLHDKEGAEYSTEDVLNAIYVYIKIKDGEDREKMLKWKHLNPDGRNLQKKDDGTIIEPDETLSSLLRYPEYCEKVANGEITRKKNGESVTLEDDSMRYTTLRRLINLPHLFLQ